MFDKIAIDFLSSWNFTYMKNIIRTCNLTVRFSKFTLNIEIYEEFVQFLTVRFTKFTLNIEIYEELVQFLSKQIYRETLSTMLRLTDWFIERNDRNDWLIYWEKRQKRKPQERQSPYLDWLIDLLRETAETKTTRETIIQNTTKVGII